MAKTILLIDDDAGILDVTKIILQDAGYTMLTASSETAMFEQLKKQQPDVILLDILLSGTDGIDICRKLKADPKTKDIPVVIMSADTSIEEKFKEAGADDYLTKPFDIEDLEEKVKKWTTSS